MEIFDMRYTAANAFNTQQATTGTANAVSYWDSFLPHHWKVRFDFMCRWHCKVVRCPEVQIRTGM